MPNEVFETVSSLMAVREFADRPVAGETVRRVLEAGRLSASSMNRQPWHFVAVRERGHLEELGALVRTGPYIAQSAFAVACAYEKESPFGVSDTSRAIQSMMLTAWADGVGSNWTGFGNLPEAAQALGLPEQYQLLAVIAFGYPARPVKGRKKRRPLSEVASAERFGEPFR